MEETYQNSYVDLGTRNQYRFQMNNASISTTFIYKLDLYRRPVNDGGSITLQMIEDYVKGCEIYVEQVQGLVGLTVADYDLNREATLAKSTTDYSGNTLKHIYVFNNQENRSTQIRKLESLALLTRTTNDSLPRLQENLRN